LTYLEEYFWLEEGLGCLTPAQTNNQPGFEEDK